MSSASAATKRRRPAPLERFDAPVHVRFPSTLRERLRQLARKRLQSEGSLFRLAVLEFVEREHSESSP